MAALTPTLLAGVSYDVRQLGKTLGNKYSVQETPNQLFTSFPHGLEAVHVVT